MIHDILIIHRQSELPLFHQSPGNNSKLASMGLDSSTFAKLAVTIVKVLHRAGALERLRLREVKISFNVFEEVIFALVTSHDHDEFEINHSLNRFSTIFHSSYTREVISQYKDQALSFNGFDISSLFRSDSVVISDTDTLMKSMIQRLADMIGTAGRLGAEADMLSEKRSLDGTVIMSINAMHQELISKLDALKVKMDQFPVLSGPDFHM